MNFYQGHVPKTLIDCEVLNMNENENAKILTICEICTLKLVGISYVFSSEANCSLSNVI